LFRTDARALSQVRCVEAKARLVHADAARLAQRTCVVVDADRARASLREHLQTKTGPARDIQYLLAGGEMSSEAIATAMLAPQFGRRVVGESLLGAAHARSERPRAAKSSVKRCCQVCSWSARRQPAERMRSDCSWCAR